MIKMTTVIRRLKCNFEGVKVYAQLGNHFPTFLIYRENLLEAQKKNKIKTLLQPSPGYVFKVLLGYNII